jgi:hypothetical protein
VLAEQIDLVQLAVDGLELALLARLGCPLAADLMGRERMREREREVRVRSESQKSKFWKTIPCS